MNNYLSSVLDKFDCLLCDVCSIMLILYLKHKYKKKKQLLNNEDGIYLQIFCLQIIHCFYKEILSSTHYTHKNIL